MKYILTENKLNSSIEKFILQTFPFVVSVHFVKKGVWLASEDRRIEQTLIKVITDPNKVLEGNVGENNKRFYGLRADIWNSINPLFNLKLEEYGSNWDLNVFMIKAERI